MTMTGLVIGLVPAVGLVFHLVPVSNFAAVAGGIILSGM